MRSHLITANLDRKVTFKEMRFKQFDTGHIIQIRVVSKGKDYPLDGHIALGLFKIPNKPLEERHLKIEGSMVTVELDSYLLSEHGIVPFEVELRKGTDVTKTFRIQYVVEQSFDIVDAVTTEPRWDLIKHLLDVDPTNFVGREEYENALKNIENGLPVDLSTYAKLMDLHRSALTGNFYDLEGIPTKLSQFENDLGFSGGGGNIGGGGGTTVVSGSGYGVLLNGNDTNKMITAGNANEVLRVEGTGLSSVELNAKTNNTKDTLKINTRFPTWKEVTGNPATIFNDKDFIFENNIIGINPAKTGGGGGGGGLPFINVKGFKVWERNPSTGILEEVEYGAKGDNTSPDLDTKAFKRAFQIAKDEGSVNIYIPDGNYILKETINVYRNTNVQASRNATVKKNHLGVMFANTLPTEAFIGYNGGKVGNTSIKNNGNIFFDGGTWDNDGTSGSVFSFINAQNFEFKNLVVKDVLDSHVFDLAGIADMIIFNCSFLGFQYRRIGDKDSSGKVITDVSTLKAYSECIQLDYSTQEAFPYQLSGQDGTACQRIRVDKCLFGKSDRFPAWNRSLGGHNTYVPTYDWLHQTNGTPTGNTFNFLECKAKDIYFLNNVVEGNGTLKYDYDQNDSQNFIIQQVRLQCIDNAIIMNNKFRDVKGGISVDVDQTPKTLNPDEMKKHFNLTGTASYAKSGVMPAKVTYIDSRGDMQTIMFSSSTSDQDLTKITTHTHNGITYTIVWCKTTKFVDFYGWQNALIMNNELTNITCGIFNMKQITATTTNATVLNQIKVQDIKDVLGNTVIKAGTEIYYDTETNPRTVTSVVGTPSTDINGNPITISPYTLTIYPAFTTLASANKPIYLKDSPSKNASTPIYVRGKSTPYDKITVTNNPDGTKTFSYTATSTTQPPRGKKCIIYGNIIEGVEQKTVYSQYEEIIKNGRNVTKITAIDGTRTILTLSAVTDKYMKVGENLYYEGDLTTPYQIMNVDTSAKKVTIFPALVGTATTNKNVVSRKPILAGESGGASIINAIQGGYIHDMLVQKNIVRNVPRAVYISGSTRMNILGNHFFQINEVEAITIDGGDYSNIIGNTFSDLNDQSIEMRNTNYFNIANNEFLNINKGKIFTSAYPEVNFTYNPLDTPTIIVMGDGSDGQYGTITGNMFVHNNANPIAVGIQAPETTKYIKMSNNSFPSAFTLRQDNKSDVGLDYGFRGNDADTLQGLSLTTLGEQFIPVTAKGINNGVPTLDANGRIPIGQLPTSIQGGGGGFKTITIPNNEAVTATSLANNLTLQGANGINFDVKDGNIIEIGYHADMTGIDGKFEELDRQVFDIQGNQSIMDNDITTLKTWKNVTDNTTVPTINNTLVSHDQRLVSVENHRDTPSIHVTQTDKDNWNGHVADNVRHVTSGDKSSWNGHVADNVKHVTQTDKDNWNNHKNDSTIHVTTTDKSNWNGHVGDATIHVTTSDKTNWNGKSDKTYVDNNMLNKATSTKQIVTPDVQFNGDTILTRYEEKIGTNTGGACDLSTGSIFNVSVGANTTISFTNFVSNAGYVQSVVIYLIMGGNYSVTFPASVKWHNNSMPTLASGKTQEIVLRTTNQGVTWFATLGGNF